MPQLQERAAAGSTLGRVIFSRIVLVPGEVLIIGGVIVLLFVAWQLWWTNVASDARQRDADRDFARSLAVPEVPAAAPTAGDGEPTVAAEPAEGATIGIVYVPRFGADYTRPLVQGTTPAMLDTLGIGHYEGTAMLGAVGNVAVAGHRQTHGAVLDNIDALVPGDRIYIQTREGYYTYSFRNSEVLLPGSRPQPVPRLRLPARSSAPPGWAELCMPGSSGIYPDPCGVALPPRWCWSLACWY